MLTNSIGRCRSKRRLERYQDPLERIVLALAFLAVLFLGVLNGIR